MTMLQLFSLDDFPQPVRPLFASRDEAHNAMMEDVAAVLEVSKELGCFPDQKLFLESVKQMWLDVYSRYAPKG
jgi:hypothetical protein